MSEQRWETWRQKLRARAPKNRKRLSLEELSRRNRKKQKAELRQVRRDAANQSIEDHTD